MKILARMEKSRETWYLICISFVFFLLRLPSLFEPDWYGDEGVYQTVGLAIRAGRLLYRDIFDNKPPVLYLLYSFVSSDQFSIRLLSLIFGLLSILIFYFISKKLFSNWKISVISTSLFAVMFGLPLIEGNIANAENFMLLPNILAGLLVLKAVENKKNHLTLTFAAGIILSLSFLIKIVALFDFAAFAAFLFFVNYSKNLSGIFKKEVILNELKNLLPFITGFLIPIIITALYFAANHAFSYLLTATFFSNIGYVGYGNKFIIPQGFLILKLLILAVFCLSVFLKRQRLGIPFTFTSLWLAFSLFDAFFSQRPYTHYVLVLLPPFCLIIGLSLLKKNFSKIAAALAAISFFVVVINFTFYAKTFFYYQNFASFILNQESVYSYQKFFDPNTPNDYALASFIDLYAKPSDNIFIWGNNAQVYKLANKLPPGKYTVAYHITSYKDGFPNTARALTVKSPEFIIVMPNVSIYPFSLSEYFPRLSINGAQIYEKIF